MGVQEDVLKVKINAPAVKGKANKALISFLAEKLEVRKSEIEIISGHTSKIKKIEAIGEGTFRTKVNVRTADTMLKPSSLLTLRP